MTICDVEATLILNVAPQEVCVRVCVCVCVVLEGVLMRKLLLRLQLACHCSPYSFMSLEIIYGARPWMTTLFLYSEHPGCQGRSPLSPPPPSSGGRKKRKYSRHLRLHFLCLQIEALLPASIAMRQSRPVALFSKDIFFVCVQCNIFLCRNHNFVFNHMF